MEAEAGLGCKNALWHWRVASAERMGQSKRHGHASRWAIFEQANLQAKLICRATVTEKPAEHWRDASATSPRGPGASPVPAGLQWAMRIW